MFIYVSIVLESKRIHLYIVYHCKLIYTLKLCHTYEYNPCKTVNFTAMNDLLSIYMMLMSKYSNIIKNLELNQSLLKS